EVSSALEVSRGLLPTSLPPLDVSRQLEYPRVVRQSPAAEFQFGKSAFVVEVSPIKILGAGEVGFTGIWIKTRRRLDCGFGQGQARCSMIETKPIKLVVSPGELAICL